MLDVAIIGAGPAGLSTAYRLGGGNIAVFERELTVGGRSRTTMVAGEPVNLGALYVYLGTDTEQICRELGVEFLPVQADTYSAHYNGITVIARSDDDLVEGLPVSEEAKADLRDMLASLGGAYGKYASHGLNEASKALSRVSFADFLGQRHPEVATFLRTACIAASTTWPEELSAQYGMRYVASYLAKDPDHRGYIVGGMNDITHALNRRLPGVVRFGHNVTAVERLGDGYRLQVASPAGVEVIEARKVVMAVPGPLVAPLAPWLPDWKLQAIEAIPTAVTVVMAVVLESTPDSPWDPVYFMPTVGAAFQGLFQGKVGPAFRPFPTGKTVLYLYRHREPAEEIFDRDDDEITAEWLDSLYRIFPDARANVAGTYLQKWPECFAYIRADREEPLELVQCPVDGMHFAGDYASASAGSHGAFGTGERVAAEIHAAVGAPVA